MKLILAPMRGITNAIFRKIYCEHFPYFDYAVAPFVSPTISQNLGKGLFKDLSPKENENSMPVEPQILLNNPDVLYPFLDKIFVLGYKKVNINMGCPANVVVKKNKGAALLENLDLIDKILSKIAEDKRFEFSVKLRLGMTNKRRIFDILPIIEKYEPSVIIVHPRTADMQYSGEANIDIFQEVTQNVKSNIIYNGDVFSLAKYKKINALFGEKIVGVMLGRGALVNPLLCGQIKEKKFQNPEIEIKKFIDNLYFEYEKLYFGERSVLGKMKELWKYLQFSFENSKKCAKKILKSESLYFYRKHCDELFENCKYFCNNETLGNIQMDGVIE
ncbi:MAG: tRNA-dihydrouridine synthase family protein [Chitinivibrionia bacterium]|nr:tRNA-dihydrouridine synthase family protein [Chitinivibrionia bacterium]